MIIIQRRQRMKFLHTADWHIGKKLNGFDLLEEQEYAFKQILTLAKEEDVDGVIIAGDLYDRAIPPIEAIKAFDGMLERLNIIEKLPIYAISGNHDGANRLNFANQWMAENHLFLHTKLEEAFQPIEIEGIQLFLLPFFDPIDARIYYGVEDVEEMKTINHAMARVVKDLEKKFDPNKKQVLVTHFNVTGKKNPDYKLTSETTSTVGGLNSVSAEHFNKFHYVALGHLHLWQASPDEHIRYSGSPVKFNTKEAKNEKGVYIVELSEEGTIYLKFHKIKPNKDLIVLKGSFEELISEAFYTQQPTKGSAFFSIKLTSRSCDSHIRQKLSDIYGDIVELTYHLPSIELTEMDKKFKVRTSRSIEEVVENFYADVTCGDSLTKSQKKIVEDIVLTLNKKENNQ